MWRFICIATTVIVLTGCEVERPKEGSITVYADRELSGEAVYAICFRSVTEIYAKHKFDHPASKLIAHVHCEELRREIIRESHIRGEANHL